MLKKFVHYVSLNILGMVSIAFCIFVDTFFIALNMGADGLTALNVALPIYSIINGLGLMVGVGGGAQYATLYAAGLKEKAKQIYSVAVISAAAFVAILILLGLFQAEQIAVLLGARDEIVPMSTAYIRTILIMSPALVFSNLMMSFTRNDGAPKAAMIATVTMAMSNIILDWIFIFPLGLGMFGAAAATMSGSTLGLLYLLWHSKVKKANFQLVKIEQFSKKFKRIITVGVPTLIGELSSAIVIFSFNLIILALSGNMGIAVFGIVTNLALIVIAMFNGLGQGMQPLVSKAFGENKLNEQQVLLKYGIFTAIGLAAVLILVVYLFTDPLTNVFNSENDDLLRTYARTGVRIYFTGFIFVGINIVSIIYFSVTASPRIAHFLSILRSGLILIPLALLFSHLWGTIGVWLSYPVAEALILLTALVLGTTVAKTSRKTMNNY